jgi:hypothetical protein
MIGISILVALTASLTAAAVQAADAPGEIKLGTLYAASGPFSSTSVPLHYGLKLWIDQKNAEGGVFAKAFDKKIPLKLVAYDDEGNAAAAATLYSRLITSAPAISDLSWLNPTPHAIAVYASRPLSPAATQHSLPSGRYPFY